MKKKKNVWIFISSILYLLFFYSTAFASNSFTATKDASNNVTGITSFTISTHQTVRWSATATGSATAGHSFYLSQAGPNMDDIPVTTSLPDGSPASGTLFLNAGTYYIAINTFAMGPGSYTITYDLQASFAVSPTSFNFGNVIQGQSSPQHSFSLTLTGDMLPANGISFTNPDPTHFVITGPSISNVPATFQVKFNAGTTVGAFSDNVIIHATNPSGFPISDKTVLLTGTTIASVPDVNCIGANCSSGPLLGTADGSVGGTKDLDKTFGNSGTNVLNISSITLSHNEGGVFSSNGTPNITPLPVGGTRHVSIHFTPPVSPEEHTYCGSILIVSNDPAHPTLECFFQARSHHPVPKMVVEENDLDYHDVELGFSYTKAIVVRNDGDADLVITISKVTPATPAIAQWSTVDLANNVSILPGANQVFKETFSPNILGGPYSFQLLVSSNDLLNASQTVTLHGNATTPIPIDNVLVVDRSGSMSEAAGTQTKIQALQKAANLYVDLLRNETGSGTGDKVGIVKYNQTNSVYLPLDYKTPAHYTDAQTALNDAAIADVTRLKPDGMTGIGGAMQTAATTLGPSLSPGRKQVMIVMTDGIQNTHPYINEVLGTITTNNPDLQLYSLGLGNDIDAAALQSITNKGAGGYQQVSGDLLGNNMFALEEFYFKIYSNATGANLIVDPTQPVNISPGTAVDVITAQVVSSDRYATFLVLDDPDLRKYYSLELIDPTGQVITIGSNVGGIQVQLMTRLNYTIYKVIFPDISQSLSYVGNWTLRLIPNGKWTEGNRRDSTDKYLKTRGEYIQPSQGLIPIGFGAAVRSDYNMEVTATANNYQPGAVVTLTAKLMDRGWPSSGTIHLISTKPDGTTSSFILYDDGSHNDNVAGDGVYTNTFSQTSLQGNYKFFFNATGLNERGELVPRQAVRYIGLSVPSSSTGDNPKNPKSCFPCWVNWILLILLLVIIALIIRCCRRMKIN